MAMGFDEWFDENVKMKGELNGYKWSETFAMILWWLWKWRNNFIFQGKDKQISNRIEWIRNQQREITEAFKETGPVQGIHNRYINKMIKWQVPEEGWVAINTDASYDTSGRGGGGLVARNADGEWIIGGSFKLYASNVIDAECQAILESLKWAEDKKLKKVIIYSDAEKAIQWIKGGCIPRGPLGRTIRECRCILNNRNDTEIMHVYRELNEIANHLARMASKGDKRWQEWASPPKEVQRLVHEDRRRVPRARR